MKHGKQLDLTYVTLSHIAKKLGVSWHTVWRKAQRGEIPAYRAFHNTGEWRVSMEDWQAYCEQRGLAW